jgi:hypothetical protein
MSLLSEGWGAISWFRGHLIQNDFARGVFFWLILFPLLLLLNLACGIGIAYGPILLSLTITRRLRTKNSHH